MPTFRINVLPPLSLTWQQYVHPKRWSIRRYNPEGQASFLFSMSGDGLISPLCLRGIGYRESIGCLFPPDNFKNNGGSFMKLGMNIILLDAINPIFLLVNFLPVLLYKLGGRTNLQDGADITAT
jgi:hypothetical protein